MKFIKISQLFFFLMLFMFSCKNGPKTSGEKASTTYSNNDIAALQGSQVTDISDVFIYKIGQLIAIEDNAMLLKSTKAFDIYIEGKADAQIINFEENYVIAFFFALSDNIVTFVVDAYDNTGENTRIEVSQRSSENKVTSYRPAFVLQIPKSELKGFPEVKMNDKEISIVSVE